MHRKRAQGFSLLELIVVVGMALIVAAIAMPNMMTAIANYRLRSASSNLAGLFQSARMTSVHDNRFYAVRYGLIGTGKIAFVDLNNNNTFDAGEPSVQFPQGTTVVGGGGPSLAGLSLGWVPKPPPIRFNQQGFPCAISGSTCVTMSGGYTVGYFQYVTDTRGKWAGVLVSPGGRIRSYMWSGSAWTN